jgi:hypothetical protein
MTGGQYVVADSKWPRHVTNMKYPLHVVERPGNTLEPYAIADADNVIVCTVMQSGWSWSFANWIVRSANRWHRWRKFFCPYTRDDWLWERNPRA